MLYKYSVLMSVYFKENPDWLKLSIQSMLNQTIKPSEIVIIKDGVLTKELDIVLEQFKNEYPSMFNIIALEENVGLGEALRVGIVSCKNELIARMDSDDYSDPTRCEKQLKIFKDNPTFDVVGTFEGEFENEISNLISVHKVPEFSTEIAQFMKKRCALLHPTVMYRKSFVLKCGNYRHVPLYEDYDLFIRFIENNAKCYNIQETLYFMRVNDAFYKRRGGLNYAKTVLKFKYKQYQNGFMSVSEFLVSAGGQAIVCLMPNKIRKYIYLNFLR